MSTRLIDLAESLPACRVALVGDFMIDRYLYGNAERLSPEAPVPVLHFQREDLRLGGAGSVAANLATLGADVAAVGVVGDDAAGQTLRDKLAALGVDGGGLIASGQRPTTCKVRLVGLAQHRHPQQMIRLDYEDPAPVPAALEDELAGRAEAAMEGAEVVCIEDYNKGLLGGGLCRRVIDLANARKLPTFVDPAAVSDYARYRGATCLKLNRTETEKAGGLPCRSDADYDAAASKLLKTLELRAVVITLDKDGAYLATAEGEDGQPAQRRHLTTRPRAVYDVTGAGDMVLAALAVARAAGAGWVDAVALANVAGGLEVERFGAVPVTPGEIVQELLSELRETDGKERPLGRLLAELRRHREAGKRVVFTNGCFDLIHLGHVKYFQFAKAQGDILVVGVNTDAGIRRLKGEKRPVIAEGDRVGVLEELESIDYLVRFDEDTPLGLIESIRPDVLVKGADYAKEEVVGWEVVERDGGRVALAPLIDGRSTSAVIRRIVEAYQ